MAEASGDLVATLNADEFFAADPTFQDPAVMEACFKAFDKDSDGLLALADFASLCRALFRNDQGKAYSISDKHLQEMFDVFDKNGDGYIDSKEFQFCWQHWIKPIVRPVSGLIIVDVQNDFISGSLSISECPAGHDGADCVAPINEVLDTVTFDSVYYTLDWHPENHVSFIENVSLRKLHPSSKVTADKAVSTDTVIFEGPPMMEQKLWPKHCVQQTWGAELHPDLKLLDSAILIHKGTNPEVDSYSAFWDNNKLAQTNLSELIRQRKITDIYCCGIAFDVCVGATAKHAVELGYRTILMDDACRGITPDGITETRDTLIKNHAAIVHSAEVKAMVEGRDRRPDLGYFSAMRLRDARKTAAAAKETATPRDSVIFVS